MTDLQDASEPTRVSGASAVLQEGGYAYPADYLIAIADQGDSLLFRNDREWQEYVIARSVLGGYEEDADD
jgi:hypothetical protein